MEKLNTIQKFEKLNEIFAVDDKGPGGANHKYIITKKECDDKNEKDKIVAEIQLQCGPRKENDSKHGVIDSDLLEIVRHRMQSFQAGAFSSEYNAKALEHIELALMYLNRRVEDRIERDVLGKNIK